MDTCQECSSTDLQEDYTNGCTVCTNCGLCASSYMLSHQAEWRDEEQSRVGRSDDTCLSTMINSETSMSRLHSNTTVSYGTRKCIKSQKMIGRYLAALNLGPIVEHRTNEIFKDFCNLGKIKNRNVCILASIYLAATNSGIPRTFKEIEAVASTLNKDISALIIQQMADQIMRKLNLTLEQFTASQLVSRYCSYLKIGRLEIRAEKLAQTIHMSYSSHTIAAVAIKSICDDEGMDMSFEKLGTATLGLPLMIKIAYLEFKATLC